MTAQTETAFDRWEKSSPTGAPNQRKWLEALKSGKYVHGKMCLEDLYTNAMCCLGVGCAAFGIRRTEVGSNAAYGEDGMTGDAPHELVTILKLRGSCGQTKGGLHLTIINDDDETTSYAPIIKIIEDSPELVFTEPA